MKEPVRKVGKERLSLDEFRESASKFNIVKVHYCNVSRLESHVKIKEGEFHTTTEVEGQAEAEYERFIENGQHYFIRLS